MKRSNEEDSNEHARKRLKQLEETLKKLTELTKCPACLGNLPRNLVSCTNGHLVCISCRQKLKRCPMCKVKFSNVKLTCLGQIIEELPRVCIYDGCNSEMRNVTEHEEWCKERPTECEIGDCSWNGSAKHLLAHLKQDHPEQFLSSGDPEALSDLINLTSTTTAHEFGGIVFWRTTTLNRPRNRLTVRAACVPTGETRDAYRQVIRFKSNDSTQIAATTSKSSKVGGALGENAITFDLKELNRYVDSNGSFHYYIEVAEIPQEET